MVVAANTISILFSYKSRHAKYQSIWTFSRKIMLSLFRYVLLRIKRWSEKRPNNNLNNGSTRSIPAKDHFTFRKVMAQSLSDVYGLMVETDNQWHKTEKYLNQATRKTKICYTVLQGQWHRSKDWHCHDFNECGFRLIEHPPSCPDLSRSFPKLKTVIFWSQLESDDDV